LFDQAGRTVVQAHKEGFLRTIFGLTNALTVTLTERPTGQLVVDLGGAAWGNKAAAGAVGLLLVPPVFFTTALGAWRQSKLDDRVYEVIGAYIQTRSGQPPTYATAEQTSAPASTTAPVTARVHWFDAVTTEPIFEVAAQEALVAQLQREAAGVLNAHQQTLVTSILHEMDVLEQAHAG
jgi:hypothetical protein